MKLLHIVGDSEFGGGSVIVLQLARMAKQLGWQVDVLTTNREFADILRAGDVGVVEHDIPFLDPRGFFRLYRLLRSAGYDIVHTHSSQAAWVGGLLWIGVGVVVLLAAIVAARFVARFVGEKVRERQMRNDMVVVTRRVVTAVVIVLGLFAALGFAVQSANVTLFGLLIATVVAALGVQQLLQDYVSGYYVLFERHIRIGDRITFDSQSGTVTDVRLRVTLIKSDAGDLIVVPNSELFTKPVTVHGSSATPTPPK